MNLKWLTIFFFVLFFSIGLTDVNNCQITTKDLVFQGKKTNQKKPTFWLNFLSLIGIVFLLIFFLFCYRALQKQLIFNAVDIYDGHYRKALIKSDSYSDLPYFQKIDRVFLTKDFKKEVQLVASPFWFDTFFFSISDKKETCLKEMVFFNQFDNSSLFFYDTSAEKIIFCSETDSSFSNWMASMVKAFIDELQKSSKLNVDNFFSIIGDYFYHQLYSYVSEERSFTRQRALKKTIEKLITILFCQLYLELKDRKEDRLISLFRFTKDDLSKKYSVKLIKSFLRFQKHIFSVDLNELKKSENQPNQEVQEKIAEVIKEENSSITIDVNLSRINNNLLFFQKCLDNNEEKINYVPFFYFENED